MMIANKYFKSVTICSIIIMAAAVMQVLHPSPVNAASLTWTGNGQNQNMSNPLNWNNNTVPADGDTIVLPHIETGDYNSIYLNNDADVTFSSIILGSNNTQDTEFTTMYLLLNNIKLFENASIYSVNTNVNLSSYQDGLIDAQGDLLIDGSVGLPLKVKGDLTVKRSNGISTANVTGVVNVISNESNVSPEVRANKITYSAPGTHFIYYKLPPNNTFQSPIVIDKNAETRFSMGKIIFGDQPTNYIFNNSITLNSNLSFEIQD